MYRRYRDASGMLGVENQKVISWKRSDGVEAGKQATVLRLVSWFVGIPRRLCVMLRILVPEEEKCFCLRARGWMCWYLFGSRLIS